MSWRGGVAINDAILGACVSSLLHYQRRCPGLVAVETTMIDVEAEAGPEAQGHRTMKWWTMLEMQRPRQENPRFESLGRVEQREQREDEVLLWKTLARIKL